MLVFITNTRRKQRERSSGSDWRPAAYRGEQSANPI